MFCQRAVRESDKYLKKQISSWGWRNTAQHLTVQLGSSQPWGQVCLSTLYPKVSERGKGGENKENSQIIPASKKSWMDKCPIAMVGLHRNRFFSLQSSWGGVGLHVEDHPLCQPPSAGRQSYMQSWTQKAVAHAPLPWEVLKDVPIDLHADFSHVRHWK